MRKILFVVSAVLFLAVASPNAHADQTYDFTITGVGISSSGTFTVMATGTPGVDEITNITGSFSTATDGGFSGSITGLNTSSYDSTNPSFSLTYYDNLFYPSATPAVCYGAATSSTLLDYCGLDFLVAGGREVNIGAYGTGYALIDGFKGSSTYVDNFAPVTFVVTASEPSSVILLSLGLLVMLIATRKYALANLVRAN